MPWDLHGVPPALVEYLERPLPKGAALVPGCGSAYEIKAFHEFGWQALAVDFSPAAIARARSILGPQAAAVRLADFFSDDLGGPFDLVYERTFLCSFSPDRWSHYVRRMAELLKPDGRLVGIFAYGEESEPPPYPLDEQTAAALFGTLFQLVEDRAIPAENSLPLYAGKERWQIWMRK